MKSKYVDVQFLSYLRLLSFAVVVTFGWQQARADGMDDYLFSGTEQLAGGMGALPKPPSGHWINNPELRIAPEQDVSETRTETYSLRFRPTSRKERMTSRELYGIESELARKQWERSLSEVMAKRYNRLIDLAESEVQVALLKQQLALDRSSFGAEKALSATRNYNSSRLQNVALRLELREQQVELADQKLSELRSTTLSGYLMVEGSNLPGVSKQLLQPQAISEMLDVLSDGPVSNSFDSTLAQLELKRARKELALEKSQTGFGLSLMEISYENKGIDSYNMTFGFRLPFKRNTYGGQSRALELLAAKQYAHLTEQVLTDSVANSIRALQWRINDYFANQAAIESTANRLLSASSEDISGLSLLRRHQLELLETNASTHIRVLRDYVELLNVLGFLQRRPLKNWIRSNQL